MIVLRMRVFSFLRTPTRMFGTHFFFSSSSAAGQPLRTQAPKSFFQVCTYSLHQSSSQTVSAQPHEASTLQTIALKRSYSSSEQALPSSEPLVTMPLLRSPERPPEAHVAARSTARSVSERAISAVGRSGGAS